MTPKQTAWALLSTCCRQQVVCERCAEFDIAVNTVAFLEAAVRLLEKGGLSWPVVSLTKLLKGIVSNDSRVITDFPEEMRQDLALLLWRMPLERRRNESLRDILRDFSPLAVEGGVDEQSLQNLVTYVWTTCTQREVEERQAERRDLFEHSRHTPFIELVH